jgi:hypothetical protein
VLRRRRDAEWRAGGDHDRSHAAARPDPGDRQFAREGEPPNAFALFALVATALGVVLSFGSSALRRAAVSAASLAAIALVALFLYAMYRTTGNVVPDVGLSAAIALLVGGSWIGIGGVPRWIVWAVGASAVAMIPHSLLPTDVQSEFAVGFLAFYAGAFASVALAVGAIRASFDSGSLWIGRRPGGPRIVAAALVTAGCVGVVGIVAPLYLGGLVGGFDTTIGGSYAFALSMVGSFAGASLFVWFIGRLILRGRAGGSVWRAVPEMPMP